MLLNMRIDQSSYTSIFSKFIVPKNILLKILIQKSSNTNENTLLSIYHITKFVTSDSD